MNWSETERAWLAGFIDGEGYIGTTLQRKRETHHQSASLLYHPFLIIANTDLLSLQYVLQLAGDGHIYVLSKPSDRRKKSYQYKLSKRSILLGVLEAILPYLKIKSKQCALVINFIKKRDQIRPKTGRGTRGLTSFTEFDAEIHKQLIGLNKRGPIDYAAA